VNTLDLATPGFYLASRRHRLSTQHPLRHAAFGTVAYTLTWGVSLSQSHPGAPLSG